MGNCCRRPVAATAQPQTSLDQAQCDTMRAGGGPRYLVKGNLVGYYPGSRRSSNPARSGAEHAPSVVISKGPRKAALSVAAGAKRKSGDIDRFEGQAQRIHSDYEALETLRFALSVRGRSLYQARGSGTTASDSSDHHTQQEDFKEFNLDASSDDYQARSSRRFDAG
ncbi:hypothetical protein TSOC_006714 [Tetrabaena socialis]|uniref:Uncharacterized protein n=1 Tax=Tetrabaena socialis TaxID=47790 RepID=A0A2J8A2X4_9CHLO|nr:hypothetical protein TSOC_006714 [Tetrabaena socialis]|eukprot:PNH06866.1 hypothetical protein TSOC_006714 [Tetrabaena socialis]